MADGGAGGAALMPAAFHNQRLLQAIGLRVQASDLLHTVQAVHSNASRTAVRFPLVSRLVAGQNCPSDCPSGADQSPV